MTTVDKQTTVRLKKPIYSAVMAHVNGTKVTQNSTLTHFNVQNKLNINNNSQENKGFIFKDTLLLMSHFFVLSFSNFLKKIFQCKISKINIKHVNLWS